MTVTQQVENILESSSQARNSDKELEIIYMYKSGMNLTAEQVRIFRDMPSFETIRRVRQAIQEDKPGKPGRYKADDRIRKERYRKSLIVQQTIPTAKPKSVERTLVQRAIPWLHDD